MALSLRVLRLNSPRYPWRALRNLEGLPPTVMADAFDAEVERTARELATRQGIALE